MIKIAVTDANIFIDLIILELTAKFFDLEYQIHTTREVYDQLSQDQKTKLESFLQQKLLVIYNFNAAEIGEIQDLDCPKGLEIADRTVFYYAQKLNSVVLSGDNKLRRFSESKGLKVYDVFWIFDQIVDRGLVTTTLAIGKLEKLMSYNDRLPIEEMLKQLKKWNIS